MNKCNDLLKIIAEELNIRQGNTESTEIFKSRIIYSVICRLSYASLWDNSIDRKISLEHFKNKINELLKIYLTIYPEVKISENLSSEIYDLYLKTGNFYHKAYKISASTFSVNEQNDILFLRGITPSQKVFISGAGFYLPAKDKNFLDVSKCKNFFEMFPLNNKNLSDIWNEVICLANWKVSTIPSEAEFLKMKPPFYKEYWLKNPNRDGKISFMRNGQFEPKNYYLYKFEGEHFLYSHLPDWLTYDEFFSDAKEYKSFRGGVYRQISCACLNAYQILPPIKFKIDGAIVQTTFEYLPPPSELYLLMLYSWAKNLEILPSNFERLFDTNIFFTLKDVFEKIGYKFIEE